MIIGNMVAQASSVSSQYVAYQIRTMASYAPCLSLAQSASKQSLTAHGVLLNAAMSALAVVSPGQASRIPGVGPCP